MDRTDARHVGVLLVGVMAAASAVILIRLSSVGPLQLSATRLLLAAAILLPLALAEWRRSARTPAGAADAGPLVSAGELFYRTWPGAVFLALHFVSWAAGARMTLAANASLVVNLVPVAMPLMLSAVTTERVRRREVLGTAVALLGVGVLVYPAVRFDRGTVAGDAVCFVAMLLATAYLIASRLYRGPLGLWCYLVPLYLMAGLLCGGAAVVAHWAGVPGCELARPDAREWGLLVALAVVPTVVGHSALNSAMKHLRPQVVAVLNMGQFVFAGALAFVLFRELPAASFYPAAALVMLGGAVCVGVARWPPWGGVRRPGR